MPKIDWTKPIELEDGTPLKARLRSDGDCYIVSGFENTLLPDGWLLGNFDEDGNALCNEEYIIRNVRELETETLHINPAPDNFVTESPIRAFTHWDAQGKYAIGKGFRPSLQHLARYLDAMISKEGWELVQILESATSAPSFVFRKVDD